MENTIPSICLSPLLHPPTVRPTGKPGQPPHQPALLEPSTPRWESNRRPLSPPRRHRPQRCCLAPALRGALGKVPAGPLRAWVTAAGFSYESFQSFESGPEPSSWRAGSVTALKAAGTLEPEGYYPLCTNRQWPEMGLERNETCPFNCKSYES